MASDSIGPSDQRRQQAAIDGFQHMSQRRFVPLAVGRGQEQQRQGGRDRQRRQQRGQNRQDVGDRQRAEERAGQAVQKQDRHEDERDDQAGIDDGAADFERGGQDDLKRRLRIAAIRD